MKRLEPSLVARLAEAFPRGLRGRVERACRALRVERHTMSDYEIGRVVVGGEELHIPARIYLELESREYDALEFEDRLIVDALMSRHHDGYVRQRHARILLQEPRAHTIPFVVQLAGEYVVEIIEDIERHTRGEPDPLYLEFFAENDHFLWLTGERVVSYWNCYQRYTNPWLHEAVGWRVIERFRGWREV